MKKEGKKKHNKILDVLCFPSKLNTIALFLIIVVYGILVGFAIGCAVQEKDYVVIPDYEEMSYSQTINPFFKLSSDYTLKSSYSEDKKIDDFNYEEHIDKKDTIIFNFYSVDNNNAKRSSEMVADIITLNNDGAIKYYDRETSESVTKTGVSYVITGRVQNFYPTNIYCSTSFLIENTNKKISYEFSEKIITLDKNDLKIANQNEFNNLSFSQTIEGQTQIIKAFKEFKMSYVKNNDEDEDNNKVEATFTNLTDAAKKFIFDVQFFAVDKDGNVYNVGGIYNLSNNTLTKYTITSNFSKHIKLTNLIAKGRYTDANGKVHELIFKQTC